MLNPVFGSVLLPRPIEWRAPTWSWASVEAQVMYYGYDKNPTCYARPIRASVMPAGNDPTGEVLSGSVVLSACMLVQAQVNPRFGLRQGTHRRPHRRCVCAYNLMFVIGEKHRGTSMWLAFHSKGPVPHRQLSLASEHTLEENLNAKYPIPAYPPSRYMPRKGRHFLSSSSLSPIPRTGKHLIM